MCAYQILGGEPLDGVVRISGAKNAVLPILAAALIPKTPSILRNCPDISDVRNAVSILRDLGCEVNRDGDAIYIDPTNLNSCEISPRFMEKMRATILFLGALLTACGEAKISQPGGCRLGERPIDLHLMGLHRMGYLCCVRDGHIRCNAEHLQGCTIALPFPSVGATENLILAALRVHQEVVICNAAREPEVCDLICYLKCCGAEISGENTSVLHVNGGKCLHGTEYTVMPDRMEAATFLCASATTRGDLMLYNVYPEHFRAVTGLLSSAGCEICEEKQRLRIIGHKLKAVGPIRTAPYDAFPTDAQAPVMAAMATAEGVSVFEEQIFSDRFRHVSALRQMGAKIRTVGRCAIVEGVRSLYAADVAATDLRGGAAMVLAALSAEGCSRIGEIHHIERGYERFPQKLCACGAKIKITE